MFVKKKINLQYTLIFIICSSTLISLIASLLLIRNFMIETNQKSIYEKIMNVAKIVSQNESIKLALLEKQSRNSVQTITESIRTASSLDFIVIIDTLGVRLSHTDPSQIEKKFSSEHDVEKVLNGDSFFSHREGILGDGYRYFIPIKNQSHQVIGAACVGITSNNIDTTLKEVQIKLIFALFLGLIFGLLSAVLVAKKIKKILLGLEPDEIATKLKEKEIIENEIDEAILAISTTKKIILINHSAKELFQQANFNSPIETGSQLDLQIYNTLFKDTLENRQTIHQKFFYLTGIELVGSILPISHKNQLIGAVATLKDRSEVVQLMNQLGGTEQYINSLRAQTHEFLNQLHVIAGLIELKHYTEVEKFIQKLNQRYTIDVGHITKLIKTPAIAGFLLGKINEAKEERISLILNEDSHLPFISDNDFVHDLLQILGNLIDNAREATALSKKNGNIDICIKLDNLNNLCLLKVVDEGNGLPVNQINSLFIAGFSTKGEKRGFGLHIVKQIVNKYHGNISFERNFPHGTIVNVSLSSEGEKV